MVHFPDHAQIENIALIESLYQSYLLNPSSVDLSWQFFFQGMDFASFFSKQGGTSFDIRCRIQSLIDFYRRKGHLFANIHPILSTQSCCKKMASQLFGFQLDDFEKIVPTLGILAADQAPLKEVIDRLEVIYCSSIGFEYMDLGRLEIEEWIQKKIESSQIALTQEKQKEVLKYLTKAELFETYLHTKYVGQKRFSLEGGETLIPLLYELMEYGKTLGADTFVLGMAHRGRLNVLAHILRKPYEILFREFDDTLTLFPSESGDVKYHKGYSTVYNEYEIHLAANSSCLESVDGIVLGQAKAFQTLKRDESMRRVVPILIHGDAAMSGQGVFYEILQMSQVEGFTTGGTIQIAVNNQIGFTTSPQEGRSTRYCTDIAKTFGAPVLHVNGEDPDACIFAIQLAIEMRQMFGCDVFLDLNGYRKYGHNESDEPAFTQPLEYLSIRSKKSVRQIYIEKHRLQEMGASLEETTKEELEKGLIEAKKEKAIDPKDRFGFAWAHIQQPPNSSLFESIQTGVSASVLQKIATSFCSIPHNFNIHPKLEKLLKSRLSMVQQSKEKASIDWGMGECLALGSLIREGMFIRLTGQDARRGTFSHRHAVWVDQRTGAPYFPYSHLESQEKQSRLQCQIYNTILSEFGSLAFEFGYSWSYPEAFVCWEAQYGDFVIGAETVIDHYITAAEQKWARYSSLVLLLPHGYEGGGPEHSSARMERFLQLAANDNIQVVNVTTPAQYFHLLRRQAIRSLKKPLIVFSPKSLLRSTDCMSSLQEFEIGRFQEVLDDPSPPDEVKQIVLCTGKIYFEIKQQKSRIPNTAIVRLEQIYPLHKEKIEQIFKKYRKATQLIWVQEEPENMGAAEFLSFALPSLMPSSFRLSFIGRAKSGSTATGSIKQHELEQIELFSRLFKIVG